MILSHKMIMLSVRAKMPKKASFVFKKKLSDFSVFHPLKIELFFPKELINYLCTVAAKLF